MVGAETLFSEKTKGIKDDGSSSTTNNIEDTNPSKLHISHLSSGHVESDFESENSIRCSPSASHTSKSKVHKKYALTRNNLHRYMLRHTLLSQCDSARWYKPEVFSAMSSSDTDQPAEDEHPVDMAKTFTLNIEYSRINCLTWVIHNSANSFSAAIRTLESARRYPELAMAWTGVDVHSWHKKLSYQWRASPVSIVQALAGSGEGHGGAIVDEGGESVNKLWHNMITAMMLLLNN